MKIEFIRKHKGYEIGATEDGYPDRVAYRFVNKGIAKFVIVKPKRKAKKKYEGPFNKSD